MELGTVIGTGGIRQGQEKNDSRKRDWDRDRDRRKITEDQGQELRAWNKGTSTDIQKGIGGQEPCMHYFTSHLNLEIQEIMTETGRGTASWTVTDRSVGTGDSKIT